jgi:hypothetical protein
LFFRHRCALGRKLRNRVGAERIAQQGADPTAYLLRHLLPYGSHRRKASVNETQDASDPHVHRMSAFCAVLLPQHGDDYDALQIPGGDNIQLLLARNVKRFTYVLLGLVVPIR